jgi:hypothetical protein
MDQTRKPLPADPMWHTERGVNTNLARNMDI